MISTCGWTRTHRSREGRRSGLASLIRVSAATAAGGAQCRPTAWALPMPAARSHCSHHSNREIVAGGNGGAKAVNDTHNMVRRGMCPTLIATALVFGRKLVAAVMQDRFLFGVGLGVTALDAIGGIA